MKMRALWKFLKNDIICNRGWTWWAVRVSPTKLNITIIFWAVYKMCRSWPAISDNQDVNQSYCYDIFCCRDLKYNLIITCISVSKDWHFSNQHKTLMDNLMVNTLLLLVGLTVNNLSEQQAWHPLRFQLTYTKTYYVYFLTLSSC